jgi:hypothetical protein
VVAQAAALVKAASPKAVKKAPASASALAPKKKLGRPPNAKPKAKATAEATAADSIEGKLPTLTVRLRTVMGGDDVGIAEAIKRLKARDKKWVPNSKDLQAYISLALSTHKDDFVRVTRGIYRVVENGAVAKAKPVKAKPVKAATAPKVKVAKASTVKAGTVKIKAAKKAKAKKVPAAVQTTEPAPVDEIEMIKVDKIADKAADKVTDRADKMARKVTKRPNGLGSDDHGDLGNVLDNPFSP